MDSVFDRWGEGVVYLGIVVGGPRAWVCPGRSILAAAAMGAAFMVSYTRAKSEGLGFTPGTGMAAVGVMPREVRLVILTIGLIAAGLLPGFPADTGERARRAYPLIALALEVVPRPHRRPRHHHHHPADPRHRPARRTTQHG